MNKSQSKKSMTAKVGLPGADKSFGLGKAWKGFVLIERSKETSREVIKNHV